VRRYSPSTTSWGCCPHDAPHTGLKRQRKNNPPRKQGNQQPGRLGRLGKMAQIAKTRGRIFGNLKDFP
jgi:hypothetical protein